jgi:hypothetical protein
MGQTTGAWLRRKYSPITNPTPYEWHCLVGKRGDYDIAEFPWRCRFSISEYFQMHMLSEDMQGSHGAFVGNCAYLGTTIGFDHLGA